MKLGVLALQGDFDMHRKALDRIGVESAEVRLPEQLDDVAGLVMPGGESTTLLKLMDTWEFIPAPRILRFGPGVTPLVHHNGECVMARQGHILVAAFHPELTDDTAVHTYFADMVRGAS